MASPGNNILYSTTSWPALVIISCTPPNIYITWQDPVPLSYENTKHRTYQKIPVLMARSRAAIILTCTGTVYRTYTSTALTWWRDPMPPPTIILMCTGTLYRTYTRTALTWWPDPVLPSYLRVQVHWTELIQEQHLLDGQIPCWHLKGFPVPIIEGLIKSKKTSFGQHCLTSKFSHVFDTLREDCIKIHQQKALMRPGPILKFEVGN